MFSRVALSERITVAALTLSSPAKLNLFLAITGRRPDGFHDLVSVVAPLEFGDTLAVELRDTAGFTLTCDNPELACDDSNLIVRAARAFAVATAWHGGAAFRLEKRIPVGAGLGGGSSNAATALLALNRVRGRPLAADALASVAATIGSDCPLFLHDGPVVMRGRGDRVEALAPEAANRLRGRRVLVFKPSFGVPTAWAYRRLAETALESTVGGAASPYLSSADAEARLAAWVHEADAGPGTLLFNNMEPPVFGKFLALPTLLETLRCRFGLEPRMTGSGSACFALLAEDAPVAEIEAVIRTSWGESAFIAATRLA